MKRDKYILYVNGGYYVRESLDDGRFYVCDVDGIAPGENLEHIGDDFATLDEAIVYINEECCVAC